MTQIFADTFYFLALFNGRDAAHGRAIDAATALQGVLVTTDWVLTETADALSDRLNRCRCGQFIEDLRGSPDVIIEPATRIAFEAGFELYRQREDKDWSLTDCISFVVRGRGINDALTGDHHFEQAGFRALLK